jgi:hypothetical protein
MSDPSLNNKMYLNARNWSKIVSRTFSFFIWVCQTCWLGWSCDMIKPASILFLSFVWRQVSFKCKKAPKTCRLSAQYLAKPRTNMEKLIALFTQRDQLIVSIRKTNHRKKYECRMLKKKTIKHSCSLKEHMQLSW